MISSRPYLLRAMYEWLVDNELTPYLKVDAEYPNVSVPPQYVKDGQIILNVAPLAVHRFLMGNDDVTFHARFSGVSYHIVVPVKAIQAIYAFENGRGMVFEEDEDGGDDGDGAPVASDQAPPKKGKPSLKVVK